MGFFDKLEADFQAFTTWFNGNPIGQAIEADYRAAVAELQNVGAQQLELVVKQIGVACLGALAGGGSPSAAIAAGVAAAIPAFKAAQSVVSAATINTLVTTVVNQVNAAAVKAQ